MSSEPAIEQNLGRKLRWLALVVLMAGTSSAPSWSQLEEVAVVERDQVLSLGLVLRDLAPEYLDEKDADPRVHAVLRESTAWFVEEGSAFERYFAFAQALMVLERGGWGPFEAVVSALGFELERSIVDPGAEVVVSPKWFFALEGLDGGVPPELAQALPAIDVHLRLVDAAGRTLSETTRTALSLADREEIRFAGRESGGDALGFGSAVEIEVVIPPGTPAGVVAEEAGGKKKKGKRKAAKAHSEELRVLGRLPVLEIERLEERTGSLRERIDVLASRGVASVGREQELAMTTVDWVLERVRTHNRVGRGPPLEPLLVDAYLAGTKHQLSDIDWGVELENAELSVAALEADRSPLLLRAGFHRLAYESPWDHERVPFRLFLPEVDPSQRVPLVVVLHGAGGDESSLFRRSEGALEQQARARAFAVLSVNGRGPFNPYVADGSADVIDALEIVTQAFPVDTRRVFLLGHAMGGAGAMRIGLENPKLFRAIAALAGYGPAVPVAESPDIPLLVAHGEVDRVLSVDDARSFRAAATRAGAEVTYLEVPGADHYQILERVMGQVFDFFERSGQTPSD